MKLNKEKLLEPIRKCWHRICRFLGLPLLYLGVVIIAVHFSFHIQSNWIMVVALVMELLGIIGHYHNIKYDQESIYGWMFSEIFRSKRK